ncbi:MAG: 1-acyl-sn-glycerol-3-phosphate acyltransferase [Actinobacteria bacterium]|jgi:1-acyl-sn-glycerol-3-phosphate acyltransferase|nr:1-acyl-sn-glycerol-3-phosphate acyltransferase [Actinomycetota bacterium]
MLRKAAAAVRMGIGYPIAVLGTALLGCTAIVLTWINPRMRVINGVIRAWGKMIVFIGAVRTEVVGGERLERDGSYMLVSNHQSAIDPPLHIARLPVSVRFLAKAELFRIPIFGPAMRAVGMVETDRSAGLAGHRAINRQVDRVMELKKSLIIYPEGTRTADGDVRPFKKGAFRIAVDNGLPIVPLTLHGAFDAWPPKTRLCLGGKVTVVVHEPIPTEGLTSGDIDELRDRVRGIIVDSLAELRAGGA